MTGVKHTNKRDWSKTQCRMCKQPLIVGENCTLKRVEHGMHFCQPCERIEMKQRQMYVNGKYVSQKHPLYKAGRFKTFEGAAFSALEGYEKTTEGYVYIINNPCWDGWIKIGMAIDAEDRCNNYQTSSPYRDYKLYYKRFFQDRKVAEQTAHDVVSKIATESNGEWFKINKNDAKGIIKAI